MLNRQFEAKADKASREVGSSGALAVFVRNTISGLIKTTHHALLVAGIIAVAALALVFVRPETAGDLKAFFANAGQADPKTDADIQSTSLSAMPGADHPSATMQEKATPAAATGTHGDGNSFVGTSRQQQWVTSWLSKRYRVAADATNMLVSAAYLTAKEIKLDPLLILSVIAIESRFNPFAESPVGAQGLMQVMSKVHYDKFEDLGGVKAALNPVANIKVGALILKEYVERGGSVEAGLKLYVGAGAYDHDSGYGAKVLAEYSKLKEVAMGKKVPTFSTSANAAPQKSRAPERKAAVAGESESASKDSDDLSNGKVGKIAAL